MNSKKDTAKNRLNMKGYLKDSIEIYFWGPIFLERIFITTFSKIWCFEGFFLKKGYFLSKKKNRREEE